MTAQQPPAIVAHHTHTSTATFRVTVIKHDPSTTALTNQAAGMPTKVVVTIKAAMGGTVQIDLVDSGYLAGAVNHQRVSGETSSLGSYGPGSEGITLELPMSSVTHVTNLTIVSSAT